MTARADSMGVMQARPATGVEIRNQQVVAQMQEFGGCLEPCGCDDVVQIRVPGFPSEQAVGAPARCDELGRIAGPPRRPLTRISLKVVDRIVYATGVEPRTV